MLFGFYQQDEHKETVFGDRELTYEVRRLKEFQQYEFWVTASTIIGEGQSSIRVPQAPISRGEVSSQIKFLLKVCKYPLKPSKFVHITPCSSYCLIIYLLVPK
jgi:hypothetical protein